MSKFYQGLLFLHGYIADPRVLEGAAPKPAPAVAKKAPEPKWKKRTARRSLGAPRAA